MPEPRYRIESEKHYEILDNLFYADTFAECEWAVSYVEKMLGDSAESLAKDSTNGIERKIYWEVMK